MLSSDDGLSHSVERENSNEDENESFNNNLFSKCGIQPHIFETEHEKQDSTVSESCFWREANQVQKQLSGGVVQKGCSRNRKFAWKRMYPSL